MNEQTENLTYLDPTRLQCRMEAHRLQIRREDDEEWLEAGVFRLFPLSDPDQWLSVVGKDGKEIGMLRDLKGLSRESLSCVQKELRRRYVVPQIGQILSTREKYDMVEWTVETDRGRITFVTRKAHETAQRALEGRIALTDVENNRYDIPDLGALDTISRRLLEERL